MYILIYLLLLARTLLLLLLVTSLGGTWGLEQPNSSCLSFFPTFRDVMTTMFEAFGGSVDSKLKKTASVVSFMATSAPLTRCPFNKVSL